MFGKCSTVSPYQQSDLGHVTITVIIIAALVQAPVCSSRIIGFSVGSTRAKDAQARIAFEFGQLVYVTAIWHQNTVPSRAHFLAVGDDYVDRIHQEQSDGAQGCVHAPVLRRLSLHLSRRGWLAPLKVNGTSIVIYTDLQPYRYRCQY